jgi:heat shock protein HslJ
MSDDSRIAPNAPPRYAAVFGDDGIVRIQADCNSATGHFEADDGRLDIGPLAATMAMCAPESLSDVFLRQLEAATSYMVVNDVLHLALKLDSGVMELVRHAPAAGGNAVHG